MEAAQRIQRSLDQFDEKPVADHLARITEDIIDALLSGDVTREQAFDFQTQIEEIIYILPAVRENCAKLAHDLWDIIEYRDDIADGHREEFVYSVIQNGLTALYDRIFRLSEEGWEPVYEYARTYYQRKQDNRVVATFTFTVFDRDGTLHYYQADKRVASFLAKLAEESSNLDEFEQNVPEEIDGLLLREIDRGYSLVSDFDES